MSHFTDLFDFLEELNANNSKEWMDENRKRYHNVRDAHIAWLDRMNKRLAKVDPTYTHTPGKKAINRINNNLMFHPNKPVYKDHFGAGLDQKTKQGDYYIHIGIHECFVAGGYYKPGAKTLKKIREAIDYNGEVLKEILNTPSFINHFGGLILPEETLTRPPKGFDENHRHIDLLKYKNFAVEAELTKERILRNEFEDELEDLYHEMVPFRRYLNQAVHFEA